MDYFTLTPYSALMVVLIVAILLFCVYRKPMRNIVKPKEEEFKDVEDPGKKSLSFSDYFDSLLSSAVPFQGHDLTGLAIFNDMCAMYQYALDKYEEADDAFGISRKKAYMLSCIAKQLSATFTPSQRQEISLKLIHFCETELGVEGIHAEVFRHRNQVTQSTRLVAMCDALLVELSRLPNSSIVDISQFQRDFFNKVVNGHYSNTITRHIRGKKTKPHLDKDRQHKHDKEQRAKRLHRQAKDRPKVS